MCLAVPLQITEINNLRTKAKGIFRGNEIEFDVRLISPSVGDFVLVHAGCALEIIREEAASEILELLNECE